MRLCFRNERVQNWWPHSRLSLCTHEFWQRQKNHSLLFVWLREASEIFSMSMIAVGESAGRDTSSHRVIIESSREDRRRISFSWPFMLWAIVFALLSCRLPADWQNKLFERWWELFVCSAAEPLEMSYVMALTHDCALRLRNSRLLLRKSLTPLCIWLQAQQCLALLINDDEVVKLLPY